MELIAVAERQASFLGSVETSPEWKLRWPASQWLSQIEIRPRVVASERSLNSLNLRLAWCLWMPVSSSGRKVPAAEKMRSVEMLAESEIRRQVLFYCRVPLTVDVQSRLHLDWLTIPELLVVSSLLVDNSGSWIRAARRRNEPSSEVAKCLVSLVQMELSVASVGVTTAVELMTALKLATRTHAPARVKVRE